MGIELRALEEVRSLRESQKLSLCQPTHLSHLCCVTKIPHNSVLDMTSLWSCSWFCGWAAWSPGSMWDPRGCVQPGDRLAPNVQGTSLMPLGWGSSALLPHGSWSLSCLPEFLSMAAEREREKAEGPRPFKVMPGTGTESLLPYSPPQGKSCGGGDGQKGKCVSAPRSPYLHRVG